MKKATLLFLFIIHITVNYGQQLNIKEATIGNEWNYLSLSGKELRDDIIKMESVLDLVIASTVDTNVWPETQRHRFPFSDILESAAGLYWESITFKREKMIGKNYRELSNYNGPLKEWDINFHIIPSLPKYTNILYEWWMTASDKGRRISNSYQHSAPFEIPEKMKVYDKFFYWIECENTPIRKYMDTLNTVFYPCNKGSNIKNHPNLGYPYPSMGFYGPSVLDCNHSCKPEIHPYEWIWWLNVNPVRDSISDKEWVAGLLRDWSGRFRDWSTKPRKGLIRLPFYFELNDENKVLELEHLFWDKFIPAGLEDIKAIPQDALTGEKTEYTIATTEYGSITIRSNKTVPENALRYWLSDIIIDKNSGKMYGYFNLATSVENAYTFKLKIRS